MESNLVLLLKSFADQRIPALTCHTIGTTTRNKFGNCVWHMCQQHELIICSGLPAGSAMQLKTRQDPVSVSVC